MKTFLKAVAVTAAVALTTTGLPTRSYAGGHCDNNDGWNTAAAVLAGVAIVGTFAAIASQNNHNEPRAYCPPPPPPPPPPPQWIPGHYECRRDRVCIPGYWDTVVEPAQYGWVQHGCHWQYVVVKPGCEHRLWVPERSEWRETQVWVPGHYEAPRFAYNR